MHSCPPLSLPLIRLLYLLTITKALLRLERAKFEHTLPRLACGMAITTCLPNGGRSTARRQETRPKLGPPPSGTHTHTEERTLRTFHHNSHPRVRRNANASHAQPRRSKSRGTALRVRRIGKVRSACTRVPENPSPSKKKQNKKGGVGRGMCLTYFPPSPLSSALLQHLLPPRRGSAQ